ncbi:hypothetical protein HK098_005340 [Nowakowskiella sp. JEL0407]|nr:hypothetical protein HK098_005340 [Nowakowskiella sp. JEL0407]
MFYGYSKWQPWVLDEAESHVLIKKAWDAVINFFDTADIYSHGESEKVLGNALKLLAHRSRISNHFPTFRQDAPSPKLINQGGLSRKHILEAVEKSLERLGTSYIDLYQIHRFDPNTPVEEMMEAFNDLV